MSKKKNKSQPGLFEVYEIDQEAAALQTLRNSANRSQTYHRWPIGLYAFLVPYFGYHAKLGFTHEPSLPFYLLSSRKDCSYPDTSHISSFAELSERLQEIVNETPAFILAMCLRK